MNPQKTGADWRPNTNQQVLVDRAKLLSNIRRFFQKKNVLEVDTPILSQATVTDVYLESLSSRCSSLTDEIYLQTSPEFAMKRLLAAGSGCIFQISRAFRDDECGRFHNPEFLMLEWYRVGFDHQQLMSEVDELLSLLLGTTGATIVSYQQLFLDVLHLDPLVASVDELQTLVSEVANGPLLEDKDQLLNCLFSMLIEPHLGRKNPLIVTDFPASQSALAQISKADPRVAERFEVYYLGVELANGFHELTSAEEQRLRFEADNKKRVLLGKQQKPLDERLLKALDYGLPNCAGVALGLDRLLMLQLGKSSIAEVMPFPIDIA